MATPGRETAGSTGLPLLTGPDGKPPLPWLDLVGLVRGLRSHAVLLHGRADDGLLMAALGLAQAHLCEAPQDGRACGHCDACRLLAGRGHPDLWLLMPEEARQRWAWPIAGDKPEGGEEGSGKRKPSRQVRIDEVRAAIDWAAVTSSRGRGKWLVIHPADAMNAQAGSALLKTLEEPPHGVRVVLATEDPQSLLPTLRSRCQTLRVPQPPLAEVRRWLEGRGAGPAADLLRAAGGRPLRALDWAAAGLQASDWAAVPRALQAGEVGPVSGWPLPRIIDTWLHVCHDLWCIATGARPRYFEPGDLPSRVDVEALKAWHDSLRRAARAAEHPWSEALLLESLALQGRRAMMGATVSGVPAAPRGSALATLQR